MRIPQSTIFQSSLSHLARNFGDVFDIQQKITTGKKLFLPSQGPASIRPLLELRSARQHLDQVSDNLGLLESDLGTAEGVLQNISDLVTRARELAVGSANGTASAQDRAAAADEIDGLLSQLVSLVNTKSSSGYLFGGSVRSTAPFVMTTTSQGNSVEYQGDDRVVQVDLGNSVQLGANIPGSSIFGIGDREPTIYSGETGAIAGTGRDSLRGSDQLLVRHSQTLIGDGKGTGGADTVTGVAPGDSMASDTLLGINAASITVVDNSGTGAFGTVSIDGGTPVAWTSADTDLAFTTGAGDSVHLDFSNVTAGTNATLGVTGEGTLSLDGGLTTVEIDFLEQNQLVTDSKTGESIFVDSRGIQREGTSHIRAPGTFDLFHSLSELSVQLRDVDHLPEEERDDRIREMIVELERNQDQVLASLSELGSRLRLTDMTRSRTEELDFLLVQNQSDLEDVDLSEAIVELTSSEAVLQATLAISTRLIQLPSLINAL